jgi:transcriptional regulator with PAS, ATPase and Fis domain
VNIRIIAATNEDLLEKVRQGQFREDLYYRLKVVKLNLPPLRERCGDIALLVEHFLKKFNKKLGRGITAVSDDVLDLFSAYSWPGNVRELEHAIEHSFILCRGNIITLDHIPPELSESKDTMENRYCSAPGRSGRRDQDTILRALEKAAWNKAKAARILGISQRTIFRKIKEYNIVEEDIQARA